MKIYNLFDLLVHITRVVHSRRRRGSPARGRGPNKNNIVLVLIQRLVLSTIVRRDNPYCRNAVGAVAAVRIKRRFLAIAGQLDVAGLDGIVLSGVGVGGQLLARRASVCRVGEGVDDGAADLGGPVADFGAHGGGGFGFQVT